MHGAERSHPSYWRTALAFTLLFPLGCASTRPVPTSPTAARMAADQTSGNNTEFWYQLARRPVATNDAALHALLLYFDGADPSTDYAGRVNALRSRGLLPSDFSAAAEAPLHRGNLAYALARGLGIRGGVTMQLLGPSPRYATRAMQARGLFPPGTPNQPFSGAQFVGVMGRVEDLQRGDAANKPAFMLPGEEVMPSVDVIAPPDDVRPPAARPQTVRAVDRDHGTRPVLLSIANTAARQDVRPTVADDVAATRPGSAATAADATAELPLKLTVTVTGVEGDDVEVRASESEAWVPAQVGMRVGEAAEFRTGPRSAVRFFVCPNHVFTLDRQGSLKVLKAYYDGRKVATDMGMEQGRVRAAVERLPVPEPAPALDAPPTPPDASPVPSVPPTPTTPPVKRYQIEDAGIEHECTIRSPNTALAVRGTMVSLYDQPPFAPEAVSLTGRAVFQNVRRELVAFGRTRGGKSKVSGAQSSAAEQAEENATLSSDSPAARNDFETQEATRVASRGGFSVGDVLVGNSSTSAAPRPGDLNFVLTWNGGVERALNDLNLVVTTFKSENDTGLLDFVANPPFTLSLDPASAESQKRRVRSDQVPAFDPLNPPGAFYPRESRSGGRIGLNHIGPEGREVAFWPKGYPAGGDYVVSVYHTLDVLALPGDAPPPPDTSKPVEFSVTASQKVGGKFQPLTVRPVSPNQPTTIGKFQKLDYRVTVDNPPAAAGRRQAKRSR